jgi:hypothetical protein
LRKGLSHPIGDKLQGLAVRREVSVVAQQARALSLGAIRRFAQQQVTRTWGAIGYPALALCVFIF